MTTQTPSQLVPRLNLASIVVFGLAYMAPHIVVSTFGVVAIVSFSLSGGRWCSRWFGADGAGPDAQR